MNYRRVGRWAAAAGGVAAAGAGLYWLRERRTERPSYAVLAGDGDREIRRYPALVVAEAVQPGTRDRALGNGFGLLADYIFGESREGPEIAMTVPVLAEAEGAAWRVRFVMPARLTRATLPAPGPGVTIAELPAARIATIGFGGRATDQQLARKEAELREWLAARGEADGGAARHAYYNSPFLPSPLRHNEVWIMLDEPDR